MTNKFNLLLGVGLFTLTIANAQVTTESGEKINGSPYLDEAYIEGVVYYADKNLTAPMRYNAFQDLIEYQQNGKALVLDPSETIKKVKLGTSTFVPQKYESKGKTKFGYFVLLDTGKVTLFSKKEIVYSPAAKGRALDGGDRPAELKREPDVFYVKIGDGPVQPVESIKSIIASIPDKQEELTQYAKKEKISPRKEKEIIQLVQYYNSL